MLLLITADGLSDLEKGLATRIKTEVKYFTLVY